MHYTLTTAMPTTGRFSWDRLMYMIHNALCKYKGTEGNITYCCIVKLRKTEQCTGGAILPYLFPDPGFRPVSVALQDFFYNIHKLVCNKVLNPPPSCSVVISTIDTIYIYIYIYISSVPVCRQVNRFHFAGLIPTR